MKRRIINKVSTIKAMAEKYNKILINNIINGSSQAKGCKYSDRTNRHEVEL
jgi:hypothetical protein